MVYSHFTAIPGKIIIPRKKSWLVTTLPQDMEPVYPGLDLVGALPSPGLLTRDEVPMELTSAVSFFIGTGKQAVLHR